MGCDIHMYVEQNTPTGWQAIRPPAGSDVWAEQYGYDRGDEWWLGRFYSLFARLADVRNPGIEPLDRPRGVPYGISPPVADELAGWHGYAHSISWFADNELQAEDWSEFPASQAHVDRLNELGDARIVFWFDS